MILHVKWPNQQRHTTVGRCLVNHVEGQVHQVQLTKRNVKNVTNFFKHLNSTMNTEDTEHSDYTEINQARSINKQVHLSTQEPFLLTAFISSTTHSDKSFQVHCWALQASTDFLPKIGDPVVHSDLARQRAQCGSYSWR